MLSTINNNTLLFLLTAIGLMVAPHLNHLPGNIMAFFYALWGWRLLGLWHPRVLPNRLLLLLLALAGIALLYGLHQGVFGRDAGTRLFLVALGLKLMELNGKRDLYLVVFLAFVVAASQFLYEQSLWMGAYSLLVSVLLLATLVIVNTQAALPKRALATAAAILAQALPIAVVLFVLFPRFEAPRWALWRDQTIARSGLSDSMEPGSISELAMSDELAFRVKFKNGLPAAHQRYWRGPVLAYTDGRRWLPGRLALSGLPPAQPRFLGQSLHYTLLLEPQDKNWVYALELPVSFPPRLRQTADYRLLSMDMPGRRAEYELVSDTAYRTGAIGGDELAENTQLPQVQSQRIRALVRRLQQEARTPAQFVDAVLRHFRQQHFSYTLTPPLLTDEQPLEAFLFETRQGFCSHYAAAFVYMMRMAAIPARVVTGYQGGEFNQVGGFLEVRQADAHAWAEVWLEELGWTRVDPTAAVAPERIEQPIDIAGLTAEGIITFEEDAAAYHWLRQARQLWGHVDYSWQRWVINYNTRNQGAFLARFGIDQLQELMQWLLLAVASATVLLAAALLWPRRGGDDKLLRVYQKFCAKLARLGVVRGNGEGEGDFARRAAAQLPKMAAQINAITGIFVSLRYGRQPVPGGAERLGQLVKDLDANR